MTTIKSHNEYATGTSGSATHQKQNGPNSSVAQNKKSTEPKSASNVYEERFLFGMFSDAVKNIAKLMTGSLLTDVLKGVLKDKNQTWEQVLYSTLVDSGPSRLFTDYINSFAVRTLSFLPPEISSQIFATPSVLFFRASTSSENVNANSASKNMSEEEKKNREEILKQPFVKWVKNLSEFFEANIQPKLNYVFEKLLGVTAAKELLDANGNKILDQKIAEDGKGNVIGIKNNPKVHVKRLIWTAVAFLTGTAFLPRHTKATGSDLVKTPLRATVNTILTTLFRLNTTILHNGVGAHIKGGANFDKCYDAAVQEKTLVPLVQYTSDNLGALVSKYIPMNGAILGIFARMISEIPATFLSSGLVNFAKGDRLSDEWKILGQRMWLKVTENIRELLRPMYRFLSKNVYSKLLGGMFNPNIKNMYDVDIGNDETIKLDPELDKKFTKGVLATFALLCKETLSLVTDIPTLFKDCSNQSDIKNKIDLWTLKSVNRRIDFEKKYGFKAPTHGTQEEKATLTEEQRQRVAQIEAKELSRGFKIVWNQEHQLYQKLNAPLPSIEEDDDDAVINPADSRSPEERQADRDKVVNLSKDRLKEEDVTKEIFLNQQAA